MLLKIHFTPPIKFIKVRGADGKLRFVTFVLPRNSYRHVECDRNNVLGPPFPIEKSWIRARLYYIDLCNEAECEESVVS